MGHGSVLYSVKTYFLDQFLSIKNTFERERYRKVEKIGAKRNARSIMKRP